MTMILPEALTHAFAACIGTQPAKLHISPRKPLDFQSNNLYDIWGNDLHFIAKEYLRPDELTAAPLREYKALQLLAPLEVAPRPAFFEPAIAPIVIYEYMEGEMWDRRRASASDLSKLMKIWLKVNSISADWKSRDTERSLQEAEQEFHQCLKIYTDWCSSEFKPGMPIAEICAQLLENRHAVIREASEYSPILYFCRCDPRFANVIQRPDGQVGLIDWEDSGLRDPAKEVADLLTHPNQEDSLGWEEWQVFIKPYMDAYSRVDINISRRTHLYLAIFPIFWLTTLIKRGVWLASTGQSSAHTINGLPENARLRRYLARALAWPSMKYEHIIDSLEHLDFFP